MPPSGGFSFILYIWQFGKSKPITCTWNEPWLRMQNTGYQYFCICIKINNCGGGLRPFYYCSAHLLKKYENVLLCEEQRTAGGRTEHCPRQILSPLGQQGLTSSRAVQSHGGQHRDARGSTESSHHAKRSTDTHGEQTQRQPTHTRSQAVKWSTTYSKDADGIR